MPRVLVFLLLSLPVFAHDSGIVPPGGRPPAAVEIWREKACGKLSDFVCGDVDDVTAMRIGWFSKRKRAVGKFLKEYIGVSGGAAEFEKAQKKLLDAFKHAAEFPDVRRDRWNEPLDDPPPTEKDKEHAEILKSYYRWVQRSADLTKVHSRAVGLLKRAVDGLDLRATLKHDLAETLDGTFIEVAPDVNERLPGFFRSAKDFGSTCGMDGMVPNASNLFGYVRICPGMFFSHFDVGAAGDEVLTRLLFMVAHEVGHSIDSSWERAAPLHANASACWGKTLAEAGVKTNIGQFLRELTADSSGALALSMRLEGDVTESEAARIVKSALQPLCNHETPGPRDPHPPAELRIDMVGRMPAIRKKIGCEGDAGPYCGAM